MTDCIFCKIIKKEIAAEIILENEEFIVIKDIQPKTKGHSLVIPKQHYKTFLDIPEYLYKNLLETTRKTTEKLMKEEKAEGFNLIMNNFESAGQVVMHAHIHILPRKSGDNFKVNA